MKKLLLIDANALVHRCFHALPPLTGADRKPVGAIYGLSSILLKIFREQSFDFIAAFFDRPEPTFREKIFEQYKIHRPKAPAELVSQIIEAHKLFEAFGIKISEAPGFEADDLIGAAVEKFKNIPDLKIIILTGDLDALQLIDNEKVLVKTLKKGVSETVIYDEAAVIERYGVLPGQLPDYKGLVGDPSDNIPGVLGIGPKTAGPLIRKYGALENFFEKGKKEKAYEKIAKFKEQAIFSRELARIRRDADLALSKLEDLKYKGLPRAIIADYFKELGFKSLVNRIV
jgi:DNA polymerase-1